MELSYIRMTSEGQKPSEYAISDTPISINNDRYMLKKSSENFLSVEPG